jgi:hypothetical protein
MLINKIVKSVRDVDVESFEIQDIKDYIAFDGERALTCSFVMSILGNVMGKTLTIVDAVIPEKQQNKSVKDLVRNTLSDAMEKVSEFAFDQKIICDYANKNLPR